MVQSRMAPKDVSGEKLRQTLVLRRDETPDASGAARENEFAPVRIGGRLDGYEVEDNLAEGGMGAIYRVRDRDGRRQLALKAPLPEGRGGPFAHRMRRFLREVRLAQRMNHPGVAKLVEVGQANGLPYFTMELVDGLSLADWLAFGRLPVERALTIIASAARGVHHVHEQGVIHRDLKPANILVRHDGTAVIVDFGLARDAQGIDPRITQSGVWLGTPAYISPEQATGAASVVDARADVYSLGACLYESLTGTPPFGSGSPKTVFKNLRAGIVAPVRAHRADVSEEVEAVVMKAIALKAEDRYATALELAEALDAARARLAPRPAGAFSSVEPAPLSCASSVDVSSPELTPLRGDAVVDVASLAAKRAKAERRLLQGDGSDPIPAAPAARRKSSEERRRSAEAKHAEPKAAEPKVEKAGPAAPAKPGLLSRILDGAGDSDALRVLAYGGPALIATFGILLLVL